MKVKVDLRYFDEQDRNVKHIAEYLHLYGYKNAALDNKKGHIWTFSVSGHGRNLSPMVEK
ncbi:hypothetical protein M2146_001174 [Lachnospiraceae bacterium PF1-22]